MESRTKALSVFEDKADLERESIPLEMVRAGLHWSRRISRQIDPFELMFG